MGGLVVEKLCPTSKLTTITLINVYMKSRDHL